MEFRLDAQHCVHFLIRQQLSLVGTLDKGAVLAASTRTTDHDRPKNEHKGEESAKVFRNGQIRGAPYESLSRAPFNLENQARLLGRRNTTFFVVREVSVTVVGFGDTSVGLLHISREEIIVLQLNCVLGYGCEVAQLN